MIVAMCWLKVGVMLKAIWGAVASIAARRKAEWIRMKWLCQKGGGTQVRSGGRNDNWLLRTWTPPLPPFGHPLLHAEWRRGPGRGGAFERLNAVLPPNRNGPMRLLDLSQPLYDGAPNCPAHPPVKCEIIADHPK